MSREAGNSTEVVPAPANSRRKDGEDSERPTEAAVIATSITSPQSSVDAPEDRMRIRASRGQALLSVRFSSGRPILSLSGVSLEIGASATLALACETLEIKAAKDASIEVGGSLHERVEGSVTRRAAGASILTAREVNLDAFPGGMVLRANDDVAITGERVRLNSDYPPMPLTCEHSPED